VALIIVRSNGQTGKVIIADDGPDGLGAVFTGGPSAEERVVLLAALEQYVRDQAPSSGPAWAEIPVARSTPEPAQSWSGSGSWNGLAGSR
jgi:hypothetical protein